VLDPAVRQLAQRVWAGDRTVALRLLADRRDQLGTGPRTLTINRLHRPLVELVPGGAKKALTARQAHALLGAVPAGNVVTETRRGARERAGRGARGHRRPHQDRRTSSWPPWSARLAAG
jgi:hypothetical protein